MTPAEMGLILRLLAACYPKVTITPEHVEAYTLALGDLDAPAVKQAALHHARTCRFFPTVAELACAAATEATGLPSPEVALAEVMREVGKARHAIDTLGNYRRTPWSNPCIKAAVEMVGWHEFTHGTNLAWLRSQFLRYYGQMREEVTRGQNLGGERGKREALGRITGRSHYLAGYDPDAPAALPQHVSEVQALPQEGTP